MTYHIKGSENKNSFPFYYLCTILAFVFMLIFLCPLLPGGSKVNAQDAASEEKADFLFRKPTKYLGFRLGIFSPKADSDIFDFLTEELTLSKNDFRAWDFGLDFGVSVHNRIDLVFSLDYSKQSKNSEILGYPEWSPITQSTEFSQTPLTVGIKYLLIPRGRQVGQYSWLPSTYIPYVSGGAGLVWYKFTVEGDFADDLTEELGPFYAAYESSGGPFTYYLGGGTEINISKSFYINLDFRYYWADDGLGSDFEGFGPIELGGYRITAGIQWHF